MSKKARIIAIAVILSVFLIAIIAVVVRTKMADKVKEQQTTEQGGYAVNDVEKKTEEETTEVEVKKELIDDREITNFERLSPEQSVVRSKMNGLIIDGIKDNESKHGKAKTIEIVSSEDYLVNVDVTFADNAKESYVVTYSPSMHNFLRCVTKEYHEFIEQGGNAG